MAIGPDRTHGRHAVVAAVRPELDGMLALSPDAVLVVDADGHITAINGLAEELFGFPAAELVGRPIEVLVPNAARPGHHAKRDAYVDRPVPRRMGSQQLERRNTELEEYAGSLRRFVDVASHELRTPLAAMRGFAETLQRPGLPSEDRQAVLDGLVRNAQRQQALLDDLLDVSHLQHATLGPALEPVAVGELARQVLTYVDAERRGGVDVSRIDDAVVVADPRLLGRLLGNLLTNATRHGRPPISVEATEVAHQGVPTVAIAVRDHGPGVDADFEPRLFSPFTQQSNGDDRESAGVGLGLYLSREWATAMGGTLDYRPNQPVGARFELRLPAAEG